MCANEKRRVVLAKLVEHQRTIPVDELANAVIENSHGMPLTDVDDETVEHIYIDLTHVHLPKLAESGFVQYDPQQNIVEPTPQIKQNESHLSAILDMDADLSIL